MIALTRKQAVTMPGERVVGYVRLGEVDPLRLVELVDEVKAFAIQHTLVLSTVFTDHQHGLAPALKRPALCTMLDVVRYLQPSGVVVPTAWHLSGRETELASLLRMLAEQNCRVFTTHPAKAAVAVRLARPQGER